MELFESFKGILLPIAYVLFILFIGRSILCWFFKIDTIIALLEDIHHMQKSPNHWTVRIYGPIRPMQYREYYLSFEEIKDWIQENKIYPARDFICPPGENEFVRVDSIEELNLEKKTEEVAMSSQE